MAKFPSQRLINLESGNTADGVATHVGLLNLPYALSVLNRRGYASTTRKGVPLVFRCQIDHHMVDESGNTPPTALGADFASVLTIDGCQNNWVMRNAAVKFHNAREQMFKDAGVSKGQRGAYSHEIRYNFDGAGDAWMEPKDATGTDFTGGTWDVSALSYSNDSSFQLGLVGTGDDEDADAFAGSYLSIGHSYLVSRQNLDDDTNRDAEDPPAKFSVLQKMLSMGSVAAASGNEDNIVATSRGEQDNPPYEVLDLSASGDTGHDITRKVELGRAVVGQGNTVGTAIVDIPFGICSLDTYFEDAANTDTTLRSFISVEVLDIYEMEG